VVTYYVGDEDEHMVDHPPLFACREHKKMLRLSGRFVAELLSAAADIMPGNPHEIAGSFVKEVESAYRLPEFLIPPKLVLFNPSNLRGADALPYAVVLIDKRFFGLPARYLTPDRFDGCDECRSKRRRRRPPPSSEGGPRRRPSSQRTSPPSDQQNRRKSASGRRPSQGGRPRRPGSGPPRRPPSS
jgi:hypothetical protein